jgi:acyl dehydratase
MPIRASAVGEKLAERDVEISARQLLAYAAGVGETADSHLDDAAPGGCLGVPAFCVSLEWPVVRAAASGNPLGAGPQELLRGVHASQDSTFHRAIRPGDRLRVAGSIASIRATRAGALVMNKVTTADAASGEAVVTSWYATVFRGVTIEGDASSLEAPPELASADRSRVSHRMEIPIARELPHVYSECADIWNPIHTERRVALAAGLPDIILHGTATWALAAREIVRHCCGGDSRRLRRLYGRFAAMVIPGSAIELEIQRSNATPTPMDSGEGSGVIPFCVRNAAGEVALKDGLALIA